MVTNGKLEQVYTSLKKRSSNGRQVTSMDILESMRENGVPFQAMEDVVRSLVSSGGMLPQGEAGVVILPGGHRFFTYPLGTDCSVSDQLLIKGGYETFECQCLSHLIRPGDAVVDVGANIGFYTCLFARRAGSGGSVYAFEPDVSNFTLLQKNVVGGGHAHVRAYQAAVAGKSGESYLYLANDRNFGDHRSYDPGGRKKVPVQAVALDDFLNLDRVDFIKVDTQGAEVDVLRGAMGLLKRSPHVSMAIEYWPLGFESMGHTRKEFEDAVAEAGFDRIWCVQDQERKLADVTGCLSSITFPGSDWVLNFICTKGGW
jgi:FkbM family methyltransferase